MPADPLLEQYGQGARLCPCANDQITLVFSQEYPFDLV
ncbi:MAG: GNAT family N-acetyltransferase, partial [Synechococcus sp.]